MGVGVDEAGVGVGVCSTRVGVGVGVDEAGVCATHSFKLTKSSPRWASASISALAARVKASLTSLGL